MIEYQFCLRASWSMSSLYQKEESMTSLAVIDFPEFWNKNIK